VPLEFEYDLEAGKTRIPTFIFATASVSVSISLLGLSSRNVILQGEMQRAYTLCYSIFA
jgi:hypothetical protein